ncbi:hypothetical protein [Holospora undulata]|nr:hypothetical protein [Holospora undulata]
MVVSASYSPAFSNDYLKIFIEKLKNFTKGKTLIDALQKIDYSIFFNQLIQTNKETINFLENILTEKENVNYTYRNYSSIKMDLIKNIDSVTKRINEINNYIEEDRKNYQEELNTLEENHKKYQKSLDYFNEQEKFNYKNILNYQLKNQKTVEISLKEDKKKLDYSFNCNSDSQLFNNKTLNDAISILFPFLNTEKHQLADDGYCFGFAKYAIKYGYEETTKILHLFTNQWSDEKINENSNLVATFIQKIVNKQLGCKFLSPSEFSFSQENYTQILEIKLFQPLLKEQSLMPVAFFIFNYLKNLENNSPTPAQIIQNNETSLNKKNVSVDDKNVTRSSVAPKGSIFRFFHSVFNYIKKPKNNKEIPPTPAQIIQSNETSLNKKNVSVDDKNVTRPSITPKGSIFRFFHSVFNYIKKPKNNKEIPPSPAQIIPSNETSLNKKNVSVDDKNVTRSSITPKGLLVGFSPTNEQSGHAVSFVNVKNGYAALLDANHSLLENDMIFPLNPESIAKHLEQAIKKTFPNHYFSFFDIACVKFSPKKRYNFDDYLSQMIL